MTSLLNRSKRDRIVQLYLFRSIPSIFPAGDHAVLVDNDSITPLLAHLSRWPAMMLAQVVRWRGARPSTSFDLLQSTLLRLYQGEAEVGIGLALGEVLR